MKTSYYIILIIASLVGALGLYSCGGDDEPEAKGNYYEKYELQTSSRYVFSTVQVVVTTEEGIKTLEVNRNWDGTFGPFEYGTTLLFQVKMLNDYYNGTSFRGTISVSKNNAPFVFKAQDNISNNPLSMSYTIDF